MYFFDYPSFLYARWHLWRLRKPIVTMFGGTNIAVHHPFYKKAYDLGVMLGKLNVSVITGGGPGIMDAALCGAQQHSGVRNVLGLEVAGVDQDFISSCGARQIALPTIALRTWLLINYALAFVVFPGGIGTLDELTEVLNLMKLKKLSCKPVILIGTPYWKPFVDWVHQGISDGFIVPELEDFFVVTDDIELACSKIKAHFFTEG